MSTDGSDIGDPELIRGMKIELSVQGIIRECHELCVSGLGDAGFRYGHAFKRCSNIIAK